MPGDDACSGHGRNAMTTERKKSPASTSVKGSARKGCLSTIATSHSNAKNSCGSSTPRTGHCRAQSSGQTSQIATTPRAYVWRMSSGHLSARHCDSPQPLESSSSNGSDPASGTKTRSRYFKDAVAGITIRFSADGGTSLAERQRSIFSEAVKKALDRDSGRRVQFAHRGNSPLRD